MRTFVPKRGRGLTLVELMVTLAIFIMLSMMMMMLVRDTLRAWGAGERRRLLFESAAGAMDRIAEDLSYTLTTEPRGVDEVRVRFIGDFDAASGQQRLGFVRSFEAGPERAITLTAGDGRASVLRFRPPTEEELDDEQTLGDVSGFQNSGAPDREPFTGQKIGDFMPLGGMVQVAYFAQNNTLYRSMLAPAQSSFMPLFNTKAGTPIIEDCLFLGFDYWGPDTSQWESAGNRSKYRGGEKIWDSTRGINVRPLNLFAYHRGDQTDSTSLLDPTDDVFPQKIKVTITVDAPMPRATHTELLEDIAEDDAMIWVDSTSGFNKGGRKESLIKIDNEWIYYVDRADESFKAETRGARGTVAATHKAGAIVRQGQTFTRVIFIPSYRWDTTPDELYFNRLEAEKGNAAQNRRNGYRP